MARVIRVTGAWIGLLTDFLNEQELDAPDLRLSLARWSGQDNVPVDVWRQML